MTHLVLDFKKLLAFGTAEAWSVSRVRLRIMSRLVWLPLVAVIPQVLLLLFVFLLQMPLLFLDHLYLELIVGALTSRVLSNWMLRILFNFISMWNVSIYSILFFLELTHGILPSNLLKTLSYTVLSLCSLYQRTHQLVFWLVLLFLYLVVVFKLELVWDVWVVIVVVIIIVMFAACYRFIVTKPSRQRSGTLRFIALVRAEIVGLCLILVLVVIVRRDRWLKLGSLWFVCWVDHEEYIYWGHTDERHSKLSAWDDRVLSAILHILHTLSPLISFFKFLSCVFSLIDQWNLFMSQFICYGG